MGCCGQHRQRVSTPITDAVAQRRASSESAATIYPADGCVLCAEKHLSLAFALAGEAGYATPNRQRIIGELTAAALHLFREHRATAESVRAARHLIQRRREAEVDWPPLLAAVDAIATAETGIASG